MENRKEPVEGLEVTAVDQLFEIVHRVGQALIEGIDRYHLLRTHLVVPQLRIGVVWTLGHRSDSGVEPYTTIAPQKTAVTLSVNALCRRSTLMRVSLVFWS